MEIKKEEAVHVIAGKSYPVKITKCHGLSIYEGAEADEYYKYDYGVNHGITRVYIHYPENETSGHNEKCINELKYLAGRALDKSQSK